MLAGLDDPGQAVTRDWPDVAWWRLIEAVLHPDAVWARVAACPGCGRPLAGSDCEADEGLCWSRVRGLCS